MSERIVWAGMRWRCSRGSFVTGDVRARENHASIARRSYVWPSAAMTGSCITSMLIGHKNSSGASSSSRGSGAGRGASDRGASLGRASMSSWPLRRSVPFLRPMRTKPVRFLTRARSADCRASATRVWSSGASPASVATTSDVSASSSATSRSSGARALSSLADAASRYSALMALMTKALRSSTGTLPTSPGAARRKRTQPSASRAA
mmetsp:Transcript_18127/g.59212  ORF Transcript_18127/g.59212 Transcript_18127/m.59212 type:complete len:207 (-) Transcript_18127:135-755(-)